MNRDKAWTDLAIARGWTGSKRKRTTFDRRIRVRLVTYQRNGVTGRAFHSVSFDYRDEDGNSFRMVGVLPKDGEPSECFVVSPDEPERCWRGDTFYEDLRRIVEEEG